MACVDCSVPNPITNDNEHNNPCACSCHPPMAIAKGTVLTLFIYEKSKFNCYYAELPSNHPMRKFGLTHFRWQPGDKREDWELVPWCGY